MKSANSFTLALLSVALLVGATACSDSGTDTAGDAPAISTPRLASADNFRDVAGSGEALPLTSGSFMKAGLVYRSNALDLDQEDSQTLTELGVTRVIDLRTEEEVAEDPDQLPEGIEYVHVDLLGKGESSSQGANTNSLNVDSPETARKWLVQTNESFVRDAEVRKSFAEVFTQIAQNDGATVFHCTAGKDRAGWVSAVLQLNAGVSEADVMENYLLTNEYSSESIKARLDGMTEKLGPDAAAAYAPLFGVEEEFLQAGLDAMNADYGDVTGYLKDGVGLDQETIEALKDKLTQ